MRGSFYNNLVEYVLGVQRRFQQWADRGIFERPLRGMNRFRNLRSYFARRVQNYLALVHLTWAYITARPTGNFG